MAAEAPAQSADLFVRACGRLLRRGNEFTDSVTQAIRAEVPYYGDPLLAPPDLDRLVHRGSTLGLETHIDPARITDVELFTRELGLRIAERNRSVDEVLAAYRAAASAFWRGIVRTVERERLGDVHDLVHVADWVWKSVDRDSGMIVDAYRQIAADGATRSAERLRVIVAALLEPDVSPVFARDCAALLDLPAEGRYAVVLAVTGRPSGHPGWHPQIPGIPLLHHARGGQDIYIAVLGDRSIDALVAGLSPDRGVRVGISPVVQGLAGLAHGRDLAELALRTCRADGEIARLDARLPQGLLVSRPDLSAELATRALRPVLALEPADRDLLLDTVRCWIDQGGSALRTGQRLFCHRNTVLNRLRRFEATTGLDLSRPRDLVAVTLALDTYRLLGPASFLAGPRELP
ncbi:helix-turn-helix domain-containing protein [Streptomyces sp. DSM 44917]|uniref:Helix-turn-helix domain-containing protein n=1 Tax=Streptomyces boetiae TaxID=3075541 RepID=A0ABU2L9B5_9ACTN|nr:helix-turn-helix domain-containing protein [Streptomyces sp. DSM 44917]MDT0307927.1 helix-turn-helix domain-containing protein [Streptomyces sp. DSM 44917]